MICIGPMGRLVARVVVWGVAAGMVVAVGVAGCGGDDSGADGPTATVPTVPPDPYAVPAVIDEAYVNRVLAGLDQASGDVTRLVVGARTIPPEAIERLRSIYVGDFLQVRLDSFQGDLLADFKGYKDNPGNRRTTVARIIVATPACIFAQVNRDISDVSLNPDPRLSTQWVGLVLIDPSTDPLDYNPTPWGFKVDGLQRDYSQPANPCEPAS